MKNIFKLTLVVGLATSGFLGVKNNEPQMAGKLKNPPYIYNINA